MGLITIRQVSDSFGITPRTLRYYEQIGLLDSCRQPGSAYRAYDQESILRLQQIIILRKLRIPLKAIGNILKSNDASLAIDAFNRACAETDIEIEALSTIRTILTALIRRLQERGQIQVEADLFDDDTLLRLIESLSLDKIRFKEEPTMEDLNKASKNLSKLTDVRIVYLPPATVAASQYVGENPEMNAAAALDKFVMESGLTGIKPDLRHYGFNHPNPSENSPTYGYEMWVTIPDDMEVPEPLVKKKFPGGLYAAHMIQMGNFHEWEWLWDWAHNNPDYAPNILEDGGECMHGLLEEHLDYLHHVGQPDDGIQLDLLIPIKVKE